MWMFGWKSGGRGAGGLVTMCTLKPWRLSTATKTPQALSTDAAAVTIKNKDGTAMNKDMESVLSWPSLSPCVRPGF